MYWKVTFNSKLNNKAISISTRKYFSYEKKKLNLTFNY
jgi:hypothetical protein